MRIERNLKPRGQKVLPKIPDDVDEGEILGQPPPPPPAAKGKKGKKAPPVERPVDKKFAGRKVHDFDAPPPGSKQVKKKKLTEKAQKSLNEWSGTERGKKRDHYFQGLAESAKAKFGHRAVWAAGETEGLVVGIPLPSLALEHLFQNDVLPLSVAIQLKGRQLTNKSSFLFELYRIFAKYNGMAVHNLVEDKFSPDLCRSIMGYGEKDCPLVLNKCDSCEDWERKLTYWINEQKRRLVGTAENPGPGRTIPICFGVDSIMAKATEEKIEKVGTEGCSGRDYPTESLSITSYMRARAGELDNWPFVLVLVNHLKDDIGSDGGTRTAGGTFIGHLLTFDIEMSKWKQKIDTEPFEGVGVRLKCTKNALGVTGREILTRMIWWEDAVGWRPWDAEAGRFSELMCTEKEQAEARDAKGRRVEPMPVYRQKTVWDWDWSTIHLLLNLPPKYKKRLKEVGFDEKMDTKSPKGDVDCQVCCRAAGMAKGEFKSFGEVGAMIREDPVLMDRLRTALMIKRRAVMKGDYLHQLDALAGELT